MKKMILTFTLEDDGTVGVQNEIPLELTGLEVCKIVISFLMYNEQYSDRETIEYSVQSYMYRLGRMGIIRDINRTPDTTGHSSHHRPRRYRPQRPQS